MSDKRMSLPPLKLCPFCGGKAEIKTVKICVGEFYRVECADCFAKTFSENTQSEAVDAWNRRAGESNV